MKYFSLILFSTLCLFISAQVAAPLIGCTEVQANGNVKLNWTPPSDPNNEFAYYEIYFATQKNGPYSSIPSAPGSLSITNFVYTTTVTTVQSCYFYMVSRYGPGGGNSSIHSDTIPTIYLTAGPGSKTWDLKINYLPGSRFPGPHQFTVLKEYPLGTWSNLAITTSTLYPDTISGGCKYPLKINYQITLLKSNGGCTFASNTLLTSLSDTKDPEQPYVDSISVLPNGNTIVAWVIPIDKDVNRYRIQYRTIINGSVPINQDIDSLTGRATTSYIYTTTTANSQTVGLFVKALDSCDRGSSVYDQIRTMFLQTSYDQCAYRSVLKWNSYKWAEINGKAREATLEYRIYYSVNGSNFVRIGKTTDTTFIHDSVAPGKNICYFVRVINVKQTITASSNRSCFFSDQRPSPKFVYIKTASVLDKSSTQVKVYLDTSEVCKGISIQRLENNTFVTIGFIPYSGDPHLFFRDENIVPSQKSYTYKAVVIDSCGNPRAVSGIAKTILLKVQEDDALLFTKHLSWTPYVGFGGGVSGYSVYRIVNDNTSTGPIGYTDSQTTTFTDDLEEAATDGAKIEYVVHAVEGLGNSFGIEEFSYSNPASVYEEGRLFVPNAFAPAGANRTWKPITHFIEKSEYKVTVFNRWGKKVFETTDDTSEWDGSNCISDVYVYLIDYKNARGEYQQVKGTVTLIR